MSRGSDLCSARELLLDHLDEHGISNSNSMEYPMQDPHVESLIYQLRTSDELSFRDPPAVFGTEQQFDYSLSEAKLTVSMKDHFPSTETAREIVDPFLRAWELGEALNDGKIHYWFEWESASVIDLNPLEDGGLSGECSIRFSGHVSMRACITKTVYPAVPKNLKYSADIQLLWNRYCEYERGAEPLLSMAYAVLTFIEGTTTNGQTRKAASAQYAIDFNFLDRIGNWTASRGNAFEARKLGKSATLNPLNSEERTWLEKAVRVLIRRKAEYDANPSATLLQIRMSDI